MLKIKSVVVVAGALLGVALSAVTGMAWAANAVVDVTVTAVPDNVSHSRPDLKNYGAIQVTVTPTQNNVINRLVFTSTTTVTPLGTPATFKESIPAGACVSNTTGDVVTCAQGQARGGDVLTYVLIYESPTAGATLQYDWMFTYSQAGSPTSTSSIIPPPGSDFATLTEINSPQQQKKLKTFVPPGGGTFFTGVRSATQFDLSTTTLSIPANLALNTIATIEEDDGVTGGLTSDTLTKNTTTISIPSAVLFSAPVSIVLQRDESTIRVRTQNAANQVPLYYFFETGEPWQPNTPFPTTPYVLKNCADIMGGVPTPIEAVCVDKRIYVKNNMLGTAKPGGGVYTANDLNDFLFVLKALQNGKVSW